MAPSGLMWASMWVLVHAAKFLLVLWDRGTLYSVLAVVFALLGQLDSPFFFAFHLIGVMHLSSTVQIVIQSITYNGRQLLMTAVLVVLVVYLAAILSFFFFRDFFVIDVTARLGENAPGEYLCETVYSCFFLILNKGVRGGDVGGAIVEPSFDEEPRAWFWRLGFDLTFYIVVAVIMLNGVVVGIITATFGELRAAAVSNESELSSACFICGCPHEDFDQEGGFSVHVRQRHNVWKYVNFTSYLRWKKEEGLSMSPMEVYVWRQIVSEDQSSFAWLDFPSKEKSRKAAESATVLRTLEEILQKLSRPEATMVTEME